MKESAIRKELEDRKGARLRNHKFYIAAGSVVFLFGIFGLISPMLESYLNSPSINFSCWTPIFLVGGVVAAVKGFLGYRQENRKI